MGLRGIVLVWACLLISVAVNIFFITDYAGGRYEIGKATTELGWSRRAAEEAEAVAAINCSGHGRAYLDGALGGTAVDGMPVCECNQCYEGPRCSFFNLSDLCLADADGGDPLYLEPFWMQNAGNGALLISGWHRMSYLFPDRSYISTELENHIRRLSVNSNLSSPAKVVASIPYYNHYKAQTDYFQTARFKFHGDPLSLKNASDSGTKVIEFVTSPNNPDGELRKNVLEEHNVKAVYDHAYYWPHYTAIESPSDNDLMLFSLSKLTGHAGSRFGWALVRDKKVYENMLSYIIIAEMGTSKETQLRALQLLKAVTQGNGRQIFEFGYARMRDRWEKLSTVISFSKRFSIQRIPPQFCTFFEQVRGPSPAYAWLKCEKEEDIDCGAVFRAANIKGRPGSNFGSEDRYLRLSLLKSQDDFNLLLRRMTGLVSKENEAQAM